MGHVSTPAPVGPDQEQMEKDRATLALLMGKARAAMAAFAGASQETVDDAVRALAWAIYEPGRARALAEMAVRDTGLGNVPDKIVKNQRKTFGTLRDLLRARTVGIVEEDPSRGIVKYAKPVGVVGAICPSTNPAATPANKAMMAVKGRNAIIIAPSPAGQGTTGRVVDLMRAELIRAGHPADLVQVLPPPVSKSLTQALMDACDLIVVTGSQDNVRRAYRSGKPAIGVGTGNVPVIVDSSADLAAAAAKIRASKIFDNSTSCSSENALVILDDVYDAAIAALKAAGGYLASLEEKAAICAKLWVNGALNRQIIAKDASVFAEMTGLPAEARKAKFFLVEETGVGCGHPFSGEKLSLALAVYRARDFDAAILRVREILAFQGAGHSCGVHTRDMSHARRLAAELDVVRVLVNQAHAFGNGGSFDNGLNFTLSMGCGTWGGNSISENLNYRNFINITHLSTVIPENKPTEEELFGPYFTRHGRGP
ncbi:MAG: aldehyde dehydrogenase family protein [Rhodospirillales bacterium]|nr:aldehyde dehydrogenase family protein [Rhodospirillales bacterium]